MRIESWAPSRDEALGEAVTALAETYVEWPAEATVVEIVVAVDAHADAPRLVEVLDDAVFLADARELVAVGAEVRPDSVRFSCLPLHDVAVVGPAPKGVSWSDLTCSREGGGWRCAVTIDV